MTTKQKNWLKRTIVKSATEFDNNKFITMDQQTFAIMVARGLKEAMKQISEKQNVEEFVS